MATATTYYEAYRSAQGAMLGLKLAVLDVIDGHSDGIGTDQIGRLLGLHFSAMGNAANDVVSVVVRIMENEGTILKSGKVWKVVDVT